MAVPLRAGRVDERTQLHHLADHLAEVVPRLRALRRRVVVAAVPREPPPPQAVALLRDAEHRTRAQVVVVARELRGIRLDAPPPRRALLLVVAVDEQGDRRGVLQELAVLGDLTHHARRVAVRLRPVRVPRAAVLVHGLVPRRHYHGMVRVELAHEVGERREQVGRDELGGDLRLVEEIPAEEPRMVGERAHAPRDVREVALHDAVLRAGAAVEADERPQSVRLPAGVEIGAARHVVLVALPPVGVHHVEPGLAHLLHVLRRHLVDAEREDALAVLLVASVRRHHHRVRRLRRVEQPEAPRGDVPRRVRRDKVSYRETLRPPARRRRETVLDLVAAELARERTRGEILPVHLEGN